MSNDVYDVVVVGAGIEGSASAYYLAKRGKKTLLLEQFPLPHSRGSSHGQSRIIRKSYPQDYYTAMMREGVEMWEELEREAGWEIYKKCGYLSIGETSGSLIQNSLNSLKRHNAKFEFLESSELKRRYPMLSFSENYGGILDFSGGILRPDKSLLAFQTMFKKYGGNLVDSAKVTNIKRGSIVTLETPNATYRGRSVVICPGPWASQILTSLGVVLPFKVVRVTVCYWRELQPLSHEPNNLQAFSVMCNGKSFYGTPSFEYPGHVKVCLHEGPLTDPDTRDLAGHQYVQDITSQFVKDHFPLLETTPSIIESCMYTITPDEHPFLDLLPGSSNIVVGAGFSGHGFKLAPVVGKVLGQLALGETPSYSVQPWRTDRFSHQAKL